MKKSKFLKKSLAMLLAVMLVVAMIPLSAAAAETPVISQITVNDVVATGSGDAYTAEIADPGTGAVKVAVTLQNGVGSINRKDETQNDGVYVFTLSDEEKEAKSVSFDVYDTDGVKTATVTVTYTVTAKNTDTSIKSLTVDGMYDVSYVGNAYTVVVPYGTASAYVNITPNSDKIQGISGATKQTDGSYKSNSAVPVDASTGTSFTVTAESGNKAVYTVKLVSAKAFTEFSVAGERKAADISRVTENYAGDKTVEIHMPYGTKADDKGSYKFTPTFTKAYASAQIIANYDGNANTEIVSGTEYDLNKFDGVSLSANGEITSAEVALTVKYSEDSEETWKLKFEVPSQDPVAAIKGLSVGNYAATIDGTNITLELPKSLRVKNGAIVLSSDTTSTVTVLGTDENDDPILLSAIDLTKDSYILRATAAGQEGNNPKQVVDYKLTIKTAAATPAAITDMTLEDKDGKQYEGKIDNGAGTITFEVPYSTKARADVQDWKLFWTASSGSTVEDLRISGSKLSDITNQDIIPAGGAEGFKDAAATGKAAFVVETPELDSKTYKIVFKNAAAKTNSTLGAVSLTSANKYDDINDTNTVDASISGKKITAKVAYNQWNARNPLKTAYVATTLPEGATLYYVDSQNSNKLVKLDVLNEDTEGAVTVKLPDADDYKYEKNASGYKALQLVVVSEAVTVPADADIDDITVDTNLGKRSIYELTLEKQAARTTAEITSFGVYDAENKTTVKGSVSGTDITITLPAYYADTMRNAASKLYIDYSVRGGESLTVGSDRLTDLLLKADGSVDSSSTKVTAHNGTANTDKKITFKPSSSDVDITTITVTPEDPNLASSAVDYTLTVKFADAGTTAKLNSVTINGVTGTPDANNKVVINLPFGAEVTSLVPTFNVAANGYVALTKEGHEVAADASYNFVSDKKFVVVSENGVNSATYTISVTTADQFSDVDTNDWYYDNVMRAVELGILSGYTDGTFKPMNNITRRDFAIMLAQSLGHDNDEEATSPFKDVADTDYGVSSIAYLYENEITVGDSNGNFNPDANITRQEAAIMLVKAFEATGTSSDLYADDAQIASWAKSFVYTAKAAGLMKGDDHNEFNPTDRLTRAEAASAMVNAVDN